MLNTKAFPRALALLLTVLLLAGILGACSATNPNFTVLKVGDIEVGVSQYYSIFNSYKTYYTMYGIYDVSSGEKLRVFQDSVFDSMTGSLLPAYQAKKEGMTLTAEEKAKVEADVQAQIDGNISAYKSEVDPSITDEAAILAEATKLFKKDLSANGWAYNKYLGMLESEFANNILAENYMNALYEQIDVTAADAQAYYDETLASQKTLYAETPAQYYTDYSGYLSGGGVQPLTVPEGYRFCKHILVKFAAEGETKDVDAIVSEIKDKLAAGEDFDALVAAYGEDPGMQSEPYMSQGYLMSADIIDKYYDGFGDAAMALANIGDVSEPVETTAGYHFIQYSSDAKAGDVPFADVEEAILEALTTKAKSEIYTTKLEEWKANTEIVKYYDRVSHIK